ncbi:unnamed protein product [Arctogadus glacialis]
MCNMCEKSVSPHANTTAMDREPISGIGSGVGIAGSVLRQGAPPPPEPPWQRSPKGGGCGGSLLCVATQGSLARAAQRHRGFWNRLGLNQGSYSEYWRHQCKTQQGFLRHQGNGDCEGPRIQPPPQSREAEGRTAPPHAQGSGHPGHAQIGNHIPSVGQLWKSNSLEASLEG